MRGNASGLEPGLAPHARAQRRELAEMRRPFDRPSLEAEFLRRRIVMNRGVGVIDLSIEHLVRLAPRSDQEIRGFRDDRLERFPSHGITSQCGLPRSSRTHCRGEASFAQPADGGQCVLVSERTITPEVSVPGYTQVVISPLGA